MGADFPHTTLHHIAGWQMFSAKIAGIIFGPGCPQHPQYILRTHLFNTRYWRREIKAEDWENIPIWFWSTNVNWCLNPLEASPQTSESFFQCSETKQSDKKGQMTLVTLVTQMTFGSLLILCQPASPQTKYFHLTFYEGAPREVLWRS